MKAVTLLMAVGKWYDLGGLGSGANKRWMAKLHRNGSLSLYYRASKGMGSGLLCVPDDDGFDMCHMKTRRGIPGA